MAVTGKQWVNLTPGKVGAGQPEVVYVSENSSVTALRGAPVIRTGGYITECGSNPAAVFGFLAEAGNNNAAAGSNTIGVYPARFGRTFVISLNATLTQAMIGSVANLVADSSTWVANTATSISSVAQLVIEGPAPGFDIGDTYPEVYVTLIQSKVEES